MTIEVSTTEKRDGKALALFARHDEWMRGRTKDGRSFFAIPGGAAGLFHMADARDCSCPDRQRARNTCKHMRAVRLWLAAFATGAVSPKREAATSDSSEDRVALTPLGAAYLASVSEAERGHGDTTHAALERMRAEQAERHQYLRDRGYDPDDDGQYLQRAEHIARLEARHALQARAARSPAIAEQRAACGRGISVSI